jgi:ER membrane protein complex subunit 4
MTTILADQIRADKAEILPEIHSLKFSMSVQKSTGTVPPPPKWVVDLNNGLPPKSKNASSITNPPGYGSSQSLSTKQKSQTVARKPPTPEEMNTLKIKKAWEIALGPAKQIPMQAIMMYMSGNTLQIFSIFMVYNLFKSPIQGLTQTNTVFSKFESAGTYGQMLGIKAAYVIMQLLLLCLGIYKVNSMGLLPTTRSDWLAWETERQPLERAYFAF